MLEPPQWRGEASPMACLKRLLCSPHLALFFVELPPTVRVPLAFKYIEALIHYGDLDKDVQVAFAPKSGRYSL